MSEANKQSGAHEKPTVPPQSAIQASSGSVLRSIASSDLMGGQRVLLIRHGAAEYRLQVTGTGKLILTK